MDFVEKKELSLKMVVVWPRFVERHEKEGEIVVVGGGFLRKKRMKR
jgi:hypothetical protein